MKTRFARLSANTPDPADEDRAIGGWPWNPGVQPVPALSWAELVPVLRVAVTAPATSSQMVTVLSMIAALAAAGACGKVAAHAPDALGVETCTPSTTGSTPNDEDADGRVDEGCSWHFGTQHWLAPQSLSTLLRHRRASV